VTGTRFYRAPEIILQNPYYDFKVDMWSIGCVLAEILRTLDANSSLRGPLFPGRSCHPISESDDNDAQKKGKSKDIQEGILPSFGPNDQLQLIMTFLGRPKESDCKFIVKPNSLNRLQALEYTPFIPYS